MGEGEVLSLLWGSNYSLGLIISLGKAEGMGWWQWLGRVRQRSQISNLYIEMQMKERAFSSNCSFLE